ncbi:unnamed protein product [Vitrella brassicaformis CCMP3155]|uniref:Protein kinase domain-containing protein n=1 Tax=Vitrella brassicaformis (strain CCMP3155) TaxID=1169540 RepID=A0A0G4H1F1_VITBC|nr:unnamed protein product [Vitrella brassicaformis CCMP3155]|eukprot:CEM37421.1 unnamed protein product [Vitrella brassicaformis CCMP3155]
MFPPHYRNQVTKMLKRGRILNKLAEMVRQDRGEVEALSVSLQLAANKSSSKAITGYTEEEFKKMRKNMKTLGVRRCWTVQELCDGTLGGWIDKETAKDLAIHHNQAAFMYRLAHVDLKKEKENVFMTTTETVKVGDFGLSEEFSRPLTNTLSRWWVGRSIALPYLRPEVLGGTVNYTMAADYWSLGVMLFLALSRALPFGLQEILDNRNASGYEHVLQSMPLVQDCSAVGEHLYTRHMTEAEEEDWLWRKLQRPDILKNHPVIKLINRLLQVDPTKRLTAKDALSHAAFAGALAHETGASGIVVSCEKKAGRLAII